MNRPLSAGSDQATQRIVAGWHGWLVVMVAAVFVGALCSRQSDSLRHPQFWAEDGTVWYAQAYNLGWFRALAHPESGYFQTLPRLVAAISLMFPVANAPLVLNIFALATEAAPAVFLISSRFSNLGTLRFRGILAGLYIGMPNGVNLSITHGQWHLAVLAFLVIVSKPPDSRAAAVFSM